MPPRVTPQTTVPTLSTSPPPAADLAETFINTSTTPAMPLREMPQTTVPTPPTSSPPAADAPGSSVAIGSFASSLVPRPHVSVNVDQLLGDDEDDDDFDLAYLDDALSHTPEYVEAIRLLCPHNAKSAQCQTFKQCSEGVFLCEKFRNGSCEETSFSHTGSINIRNKNRSLPPVRRDNVRLVHIKPLCRAMREHGVYNKLGCFLSHSHARESEEAQAERRQLNLDRQAAVRDEGTERQQNTIRRGSRGARPHDLAKLMDENPDRVNVDLRHAVERLSIKYEKEAAGGALDTEEMQWLIFH